MYLVTCRCDSRKHLGVRRKLDKAMIKQTTDIIAEASRDFENGLIKKVRDHKDRDAFYRLVKLYDARIYSVVYRYLGNREDSLEITQDVFIRVFRKIKQFRFESPFYFWVQRIAVNYAINRMRRYSRDILKRAADPEYLDFKEDAADAPEQKLEREEKKVFVASALKQVQEPYRLPLILKDIEGFTYEEIAGLTRTNVGTVKSRLHRGREELKRIFVELREKVDEHGM